MQNILSLPCASGRPLVVFDIEGTGDRNIESERIVSLGATKFLPPLPLLGEAASSDWRYWLVNPGRVMSDEVIAVHGITNEMVEDAQPFRSVAAEIHDFIKGCDLIGYNLFNYDVPLLWEELYRCGITWETDNLRMIDAGNIFKKKEERSLSAAVQFYLGRNHDGAHNAQADADATAEVLNAQIARYPELQIMGIEELAKFSQMEQRVDLAGKIIVGPDGRPTYTLRRVRGVAVEDDIGFAEWMMDRDFPMNTKLVLQRIIREIYNGPPPSKDEE